MLQRIGESLDEKLDKYDLAWREKFIDYFRLNKAGMFAKGAFTRMNDPYMDALFRAQMARFAAGTSCFGFFRDSADRPERTIARDNIAEVLQIFPDLSEHYLPEELPQAA